MEEKVLQHKKNGMLVLLLVIALYLLAAVLLIAGLARGPLFPILAVIIFCLGWIPLCGLRVLKPQEALVLTLFGKYIGTLRGEGFYAVNPFCSSVNPAAKTSPGAPIYGMPILEVPDAQQVVFLKRSMRPGFAGIENELLYDPKTSLLFGDAKDSLTKVLGSVKAL